MSDKVVYWFDYIRPSIKIIFTDQINQKMYVYSECPLMIMIHIGSVLTLHMYLTRSYFGSDNCWY